MRTSINLWSIYYDTLIPSPIKPHIFTLKIQPTRKNCLENKLPRIRLLQLSALPFLCFRLPQSWLKGRAQASWSLTVPAVHWALGLLPPPLRHLWRTAGTKCSWWPSPPSHLPALGKSTTGRHKLGVMSLCKAAPPKPQLLLQACAPRSSMLSSAEGHWKLKMHWKCIYLHVKFKTCNKHRPVIFLIFCNFLVLKIMVNINKIWNLVLLKNLWILTGVHFNS